MSFENDICKVSSKIFSNVFKKQITVNRKLSSKDIENWDSLNHIKLILEHEKYFNIRFSSYEISNLINYGDFYDLIIDKIEKSKQQY